VGRANGTPDVLRDARQRSFYQLLRYILCSSERTAGIFGNGFLGWNVLVTLRQLSRFRERNSPARPVQGYAGLFNLVGLSRVEIGYGKRSACL
jgi:hypothetical protein